MSQHPLDTLFSEDAEKYLLNACISWHLRPHSQVFIEALAVISPTSCFSNKTILELSATAKSTLSPFIVARGASATVTCYNENELSKINERLSQLAQQYNFPIQSFCTRQMDVFAMDTKEQYDLILIKDSLGGYDREHNLSVFRKAVDNCFSLLKPNGFLLIIDKGQSLKFIHLILKKWGGAGRNEWHYFTRDELNLILPNEVNRVSFFSRGVLSFADFGNEMLQKTADFLDEHLLERFVRLEKRTVFALVIQK